MGMRIKFRVQLKLFFALTLGALLAPTTWAQDNAQGSGLNLPPIDVTSSRLGAGIMAGTSSSVITAEEISRSPVQSLPDILAAQAGVQVRHLYGGPIGSGDSIDLRGFGAYAQSNTLILVNGRRFQDFDLQGFDFSMIPLNSIERIEVTRGNSGTVLYGDGAIGGVINIVTKSESAQGASGKVEAAAGSYGFVESRTSAATAKGPWSASVYSNIAAARGYRQNSEVRQDNVVSSLNYRTSALSYYLNARADSQRQNFPGSLGNLPLVYPQTLANMRAATTPRDWGNKQGFNLTTGFTAPVGSGADLTVDGGIRRKFQQSTFFDYFPAPGFTYDPSAGGSSNFVNTGMTTTSLTPRLDVTHNLFGRPGQMLTGVDYYNTQYDSDRYQFDGGQAVHHYDIRQESLAFYGMNKTAIVPRVDISVGGRLQRTAIKATDDYNAAADPNNGFYAASPQAPPLSSSEWQWAAHAGAEYRIMPNLAVFGRVARAFRVPNGDERVGAGSPFFTGLPANFGLKTQTSHDIEGGVRFQWQRLNLESTFYLMDLTNEIHLRQPEKLNYNLDPTRRQGWENTASYDVSSDFRLRATTAYTSAKYREGAFAGNNIPLVSRWSGTAGASWDVWKKRATFDVIARMWSQRYMEDDARNAQPVIPANATVDVRLGGEVDRFFWSVSVQNLLNVDYYDYGITSTTTKGYFVAYPAAGCTFVVRTGATF